MAISQREETIWDMVWLLAGVPEMIAGLIVVGVRLDDPGLMIGAPLAITLILFTTRNTLLSLFRKDNDVRSTQEGSQAPPDS